MALISFHSCSLDAKIKMNLEATVVEKPAEVKKKPVERKKSTSTEPKAKRLKKGEKERDPNAPKRPPTAFFVFMEDFRKQLKEANPDAKAGKEVAKEGGEKWRSLSDEEKKPFIDKAAELKVEYEKAIAAYNEENDNIEDDGNENEEGEEKEDDAEKEEEEEEKEDVKAEAEEEKKEDVKQEEEENLDDY